MKHARTVWISLVATVFAVAGCNDKEKTGTTPATSSVKAASDTVQVAADGTRFEPPVSSQRIPAGAWMCDMKGEVHYAAKNKGDGKCPVCSMALVQKGAAGSTHMEGMDHADHEEMH